MKKGYDEVIKKEVDNEVIQQLHEAIALRDRLIEDMENKQSEIEEIKAQLKYLEQDQIPEIMEDKLQMKDFTDSKGRKFKTTRELNCSIGRKGDESQIQALNWLESNGHEGIVKNQVVLSYGKGKVEEMRDLVQTLREKNMLGSADAKIEKKVESQTLKSWAKQVLAKGEVLPDCFKTFEFKTTKVTAPKK